MRPRTARIVPTCVLPALLALAGCVWAPPPTPGSGIVQERFTIPSAWGADGTFDLAAIAVRPDRPGPLPVALITHGRPRDTADRGTVHVDAYVPIAAQFAYAGYAAVVVMRVGYDGSAGTVRDSSGGCPGKDYPKSGRNIARDLRNAVAALAARPWADTGNVVVVGHSAGGFGALALAARGTQAGDPPPPPGLRAVVSFAGGQGSTAPGTVCEPDLLVATVAEYGSRTTIPSLWLYAADDSFFGPDLARRMQAAYAAGNPRAELRFVPTHPLWPGHQYMFGAIVPCGLPACYGAGAVWPPQVFDFLRRVGAAP